MYSGDEFYGDDVTSGDYTSEGICSWCGGIGDVDGCPVCGVEAELEFEDDAAGDWVIIQPKAES